MSSADGKRRRVQWFYFRTTRGSMYGLGLEFATSGGDRRRRPRSSFELLLAAKGNIEERKR